MTEFDEKVLRSISGVLVPGLVWGAALAMSAEFLRNQGYIRQVPWGDHGFRHVCTEKGREYLKKFHVREDIREEATA